MKNWLKSLATYHALAPNVRIRRLVNQALRDRPCLSLDAWIQVCSTSLGIPAVVTAFAYTYLEHYSGIQFARVRPRDRLQEDLHWVQVCWFDWQLQLCEDVYQCFGVDISDRIDCGDWATVGDLLIFLDQAIGLPSNS